MSLTMRLGRGSRGSGGSSKLRSVNKACAAHLSFDTRSIHAVSPSTRQPILGFVSLIEFRPSIPTHLSSLTTNRVRRNKTRRTSATIRGTPRNKRQYAEVGSCSASALIPRRRCGVRRPTHHCLIHADQELADISLSSRACRGKVFCDNNTNEKSALVRISLLKPW